MRERAGLTMEQAAAHLEKTRTALSRIESGDSRVDVHLAKSIMESTTHTNRICWIRSVKR
ncbi:helix-turn-helix transcriptional regulator [Actinokineospora sp. HBU206404]|uniref:Helix-turn-helix transcriptional regulator n=2 Tax=Actinokineospora xionganensis TaxID=2684470 RepID=A0ABR7LDG0_9PSEU|nr:helix-turn-helix transcriptional regulator [Actinokineospora xionganensis]